MNSLKALYIHIPFCKTRCFYCDFCSNIYKASKAEFFIEVLLRQVEAISPGFETIYIGGGTPTVLESYFLKKLFRKLKKIIAEAKECTVEANPENLSNDKIKLLLDWGVNRISIGCQSFDQKKINFLGRTHTSKQAEAAVEKARKNGFKNINIDLIFGLPAESFQVWEDDCRRAFELPITHLSAYMLTYEKEAQLFKKLKKGDFLALPEENVVWMYRHLVKIAAQKKVRQYEISNFAKKGFECIHNFKYWRNEPYLGLGPSAVSFSGAKRKKNISSLSGYMAAVEKKKVIWDYSEELSALERAKETAALKIRTIEGINFKWFKQKTGFDLFSLEKKSLAELTSQGLIRYNASKENVFLSKKGILFADAVSSMLL